MQCGNLLRVFSRFFLVGRTTERQMDISDGISARVSAGNR